MSKIFESLNSGTSNQNSDGKLDNRHFFFGDDRGKAYVNAFFPDEQYDQSLNTETDPNTLRKTNPYAYNLMTAQNYIDQEPYMGSSDIHWSFVDFIVLTALKHRELDSTELYTNHSIGPGLTQPNFTTARTNLAQSKALLDQAMQNNQPANIIKQYKDQVDADELILKQQEQYQTSVGPDFIPNIYTGGAYSTLDNLKSDLIDNVYYKWNSLSQSTQSFYTTHLDILVDKNGVWETISPTDYSSLAVQLNKDLLRINFKKNKVKKYDPTFRAYNEAVQPLFSTTLPYITPTVKIWYTDILDDNKKKFAIVQEPKVLQYIYDGVFYGISSIRGGSNLIGGVLSDGEKRIFNLYGNITYTAFKKIAGKTSFDVDLKNTLQHTILQYNRQNQTEQSEQFYSFEFKDIWSVNSKGEFVKNVNGKNIVYNSDHLPKELKAEYSCYSTLYKAKSTKQCHQFVHQCILNENNDNPSFENCFSLIEDTSFEASREEISKLHPHLALMLLKKFKFRVYTTTDGVAGIQLTKIQSIDSWKKYFVNKTNFPSDQICDKIKANTKLLNYLALVVEYINANPVILNEHYLGKSSEQIGHDGPGFLNFLDQKKNVSDTVELLRFKVNHKGNYPDNNTRSYIPPIGKSYFGSSLVPQGTPGITFNSSSPGFPGVPGLFHQRGGGDENKFLVNIFKNLFGKLKTKGAHISPEDERNIFQKINSHSELQQELEKTFNILNEYKQALDIHGNTPSHIINYEGFKKLYDHHDTVLGKSQDIEKMLTQLITHMTQEYESTPHDLAQYKEIQLKSA